MPTCAQGLPAEEIENIGLVATFGILTEGRSVDRYAVWLVA